VILRSRGSTSADQHGCLQIRTCSLWSPSGVYALKAACYPEVLLLAYMVSLRSSLDHRGAARYRSFPARRSNLFRSPPGEARVHAALEHAHSSYYLPFSDLVTGAIAGQSRGTSAGLHADPSLLRVIENGAFPFKSNDSLAKLLAGMKPGYLVCLRKAWR
jgi:hypothetical protein